MRKLIEANPAMLDELDAKIRAMKDQIPEKDEEFELDDEDDFDIQTMEDGDL